MCTRTRTRMTTAAAVVVLVSAACGAASGPAGTVGDGSFGTGVPAELVAVHEAATRILEHAMSGDEEGIRSDFERLQAKWRWFGEGASSVSAPPEAVRAVQRSLSALSWAMLERDADRLGTARAANDLRRSVSRLAHAYDPVLPPELYDLEGLSRELVIDGLAGDCASAGRHVGAVETAWRALRPELVRRGSSGAATAQAYDFSLGEARTAAASCASAKLTAEGKRGLELVDTMRRLFAG